MSLLRRFRSGLARTKDSLAGALGGLFGRGPLDAGSIDDLEEALYTADFGVETVTEIIEEVQRAHREDRSLRGEDAAVIGAAVLRRVLQGAAGDPEIGRGGGETGAAGPEVICLVGVNGAGKTTSAAKLGHRYQTSGSKVLVGACDTFRAAANEQLKAWCERLDLDLVASQHGADSAAVAFDAYAAAAGRGCDLLILDTAGRLHTKTNLMKELEKVNRVLQKHDPEAPHHRWLVVDGSLGANSIDQARTFHQHYGLTGILVTKLDGTSRGGALVGIYRELKLPIYFVGLGEQPEDLQAFSVDAYIDALFPAATNA